jgi:hypothetical protein
MNLYGSEGLPELSRAGSSKEKASTKQAEFAQNQAYGGSAEKFIGTK